MIMRKKTMSSRHLPAGTRQEFPKEKLSLVPVNEKLLNNEGQNDKPFVRKVQRPPRLLIERRPTSAFLPTFELCSGEGEPQSEADSAKNDDLLLFTLEEEETASEDGSAGVSYKLPCKNDYYGDDSFIEAMRRAEEISMRREL